MKKNSEIRRKSSIGPLFSQPKQNNTLAHFYNVALRSGASVFFPLSKGEGMYGCSMKTVRVFAVALVYYALATVVMNLLGASLGMPIETSVRDLLMSGGFWLGSAVMALVAASLLCHCTEKGCSAVCALWDGFYLAVAFNYVAVTEVLYGVLSGMLFKVEGGHMVVVGLLAVLVIFGGIGYVLRATSRYTK